MSTQPVRIVTTFPFEPEEVDRILRAAPEGTVELVVCSTKPEFWTCLQEADVVYGDLSGDELALAPRLKWIQAAAAGVEDLDKTVMRSRVPLTNFAGTFAPCIAETAIGMLLALTRGLCQYYIPQFLRRNWKPIGTTRSADHVELAGRTMGIAGMGGIGRAVARKAHYGLEMKIVGTDARTAAKPDYVAELRDPSWLMEMVPQVDVVVAAAPLTPETERMFNEDVFRRMKPTAYFVGLSRGKLFDDMALVRALKGGWIAGAALDVFPQEPVPSEHPIYDCPNVVMTPHTSGWSPERQVRLVGLFAENVRRFVAGEALLNVVDKEKGY